MIRPGDQTIAMHLELLKRKPDFPEARGEHHRPAWYEQSNLCVIGDDMQRIFESHLMTSLNSLIFQPGNFAAKSCFVRVNSGGTCISAGSMTTIPATVITESAISKLT